MKKMTRLTVFIVSFFIILILMIFIIFINRYPKKVDELFYKQSSILIEENLNIISEQIDLNINNNYNQFRLLSNNIIDVIDDSDKINKLIYNFKESHNFEEILFYESNINIDNVKIDLDKSKIIYTHNFSYQNKFYVIEGKKDIKSFYKLLSASKIDDLALTVLFYKDEIVYKVGNINLDDLTLNNFYKFNELKKVNLNKNYYVDKININDTFISVLKVVDEDSLRGEFIKELNLFTFNNICLMYSILLISLISIVLVIIIYLKLESKNKILKKEEIFSKMSEFIPSAFAIVRDRGKPDFVSQSFNNLLNRKFEFTKDEFIELLGDLKYVKKDLIEKKKFHKILKINNLFISISLYNIGLIDNNYYYVVVLNDITDMKKINELLEESIYQANLANNAKTNFLSKMSHEIRTPLNSIVGLSNYILDNIDKLDKINLKNYILNINNSGNYLVDLVSNIIDISKIEKGEINLNLNYYDLYEIIHNAYLQFIIEAKNKNIKYNLDINFSKMIVKLDKILFTQILNNLISNAIKFTNEFGEINIRANIFIRETCFLTLVVEDNGIGMSKEFLNVLFKPFTQENKLITQKGSGLGLAISKNLIDLMNGKINVNSSENLGTKITINLDFEIKDNFINADLNIELKIHNSKVLLIEDNDINRLIIKLMLEEYNIEFVEAVDGLDGLNKYMNSKEFEFDFIFLDLQMPNKSGFEVATNIRNSKRSDKLIPIIAMSADCLRETINKCLSIGINYHISKPIEKNRLLKILQNIKS